MFLAKIATERPVLITTIIIIIIFFGLQSYFTLKIDTMPEVKIPFITVTTIFPGASPNDVENLVTKKIEDEVSSISGIDRILSYSMENSSIILVQFKLGKNVDIANLEVKDQIDKIINNLPADAKKPVIQKVNIQSFPVMDLIVSGSFSLIEIRDLVDNVVKDRLSQIPGVANVDITGGQEREIKVVLDNRIIFEHNVYPLQMTQILKANNLDLPGGNFKLESEEYSVRVKGGYKSIDDLSRLRIPTAFGPKKLEQISTIIDTGKDIRVRTMFFDNVREFGKNDVVRISIIKSVDANVIKVCEEVYKVIPEIQKILPKGVNINVVRDQSIFTRSTFNDTMSNIYLGVVFTGIVLFFFLFDWKSTLTVAITMPASIFSSFLLFKAFGLSLNILSLMGITASIGTLVANSIVVLENIYRLQSFGYSPKKSVYLGTSEVSVAVLASALTNIIVFVPIANLTSIVGQVLRELALAATFTNMFSLLFSFTLTPMLASLILKSNNNQKDSFLKKVYLLIDNFFKTLYSKILNWTLDTKRRSLIILVLVLILFISIFAILTPKIGYEFIPAVDNNEIIVQIELPNSLNLDATAKKVIEISNIVKQHPEVVSILTDLGKEEELNFGSNLAKMEIKLCDPSKRKFSLSEMIMIFKKELADITNAKIIIKRKEFMEGMSDPIEFYLLGQNIDTLEKYKTIIVNELKDVNGLINFDNSARPGKPEIVIYPKRDVLAEIGLSITELAYTIRSALEGIQSTVLREEGNEYDIILTLPDENVSSPEKIENITIIGPYGAYRLCQLADVLYSYGVPRLIHFNKYKAIKFTGSNSANIPLGNVKQQIDNKLSKINFPLGYVYQWSGTPKMMDEMIRDLLFAFVVATILTYLLLSAILESFLQPFYVLLTLPLGLIGVLFLMYLTNNTFNLSSLMGIILLIGVIVNNAILILDFTNKLIREKNMNKKEALITASMTKLKAQIMTSTALILGILPMALQIGEFGKEIRSPFAIVSIGGLIGSTLLTLIVIPAFYNVFGKGPKNN